eukprot:5477995-Prymnesium_polylepis.1
MAPQDALQRLNAPTDVPLLVQKYNGVNHFTSCQGARPRYDEPAWLKPPSDLPAALEGLGSPSAQLFKQDPEIFQWIQGCQSPLAERLR